MVRSLAIIVGISNYPKLPENNLEAAKNDVTNLREYLIGEGKFDEVIILENADASKENIAYFLGDYLRDKAAFYDKHIRVLFAYSGHGFKGEGGNPPALALTGAAGEGETRAADMMTLGELKSQFDTISLNSFHFLALINACYAGKVFTLVQSGGNLDDTNRPAAYALTASSGDDLAWSIGGDHDGSVFFEALLDGIRSGKADPSSFTIVDETGERVVKGGIVRLGALNTFITTKFDSWRSSGLDLPDGSVLSPPWIGSITPPQGLSEGGFFFLSTPAVSAKFAQRYIALNATQSSGALPKSFAIPTRAASSVPGSPELKLFLDPAAYEIHGIDVSHHNGKIDWDKVAGDNIAFAYMKATEGVSFVDPHFKYNWSESKRAGIRRGAYHYVNLCKPVDGQFKNIIANVPKEAGMLPIALDVEPNAVIPGEQVFSTSEAWRRKFGFSFDKPNCVVSSMEEARASLKELGQRIEAHYGVTPTIFGISESFKLLIDDRFSKFNIWLAHHKEGNSPDVELPGRVPWTIWQYTAAGKVNGVTGKVDKNAFFGTTQAFEEFTTQQGNIALKHSNSTE
jgi:lysozyme